MTPEEKEELIKQLNRLKNRVENNEIESVILGYVDHETDYGINCIGRSKYLAILASKTADIAENIPSEA